MKSSALAIIFLGLPAPRAVVVKQSIPRSSQKTNIVHRVLQTQFLWSHIDLFIVAVLSSKSTKLRYLQPHKTPCRPCLFCPLNARNCKLCLLTPNSCWTKTFSDFIKLLHSTLIFSLLYMFLPTHGIIAQKIIHNAVKISSDRSLDTGSGGRSSRDRGHIVKILIVLFLDPFEPRVQSGETFCAKHRGRGH